MGLMDELEKIKGTLKERWVAHYKANRAWIRDQMNYSSQFYATTSDGGTRPSNAFILGCISALEPEFATYIPFFLQLNRDADKLIEILGLDFDVEKLLNPN
ncbi:MAG: DUF5331 domain-containing protein [Oscillatoriales cyanobacterium SM2_2_1]|nr:DUF5331 domain-containing protein [Oscillatoriales cyanobacterium SM2_2_1]